MMTEKQKMRLERCRKRGKRARWLGRALIPVLIYTVFLSAWSEPELAAELRRGQDVSIAMFRGWQEGGDLASAMKAARNVSSQEVAEVKSTTRLPQITGSN